jgi:hypothetical protein
MSNDECKKALEKIVEAVQCLSEAMPREGVHQIRLLDTWRVLNEVRELLGLQKWTPGE